MKYIVWDVLRDTIFVLIVTAFLTLLLDWGIQSLLSRFAPAWMMDWPALLFSLPIGLAIFGSLRFAVYLVKTTNRVEKVSIYTGLSFEDAAKLICVLYYQPRIDPEKWDMQKFSTDFFAYRRDGKI